MSYREPTWVDFTGRRPRSVPDAVYIWLKDDRSLTSRVIAYCAGDFRVRLLQQKWGVPLSSEATILDVKQGETSVIREVELLCDEQPLVFARTVIPATTLTGKARQLSTLGEKPLGAVLFADPATRRSKIQIARITQQHSVFAVAVQHLAETPAELWGRRTLFMYASKPLLVNEVFLF